MASSWCEPAGSHRPLANVSEPAGSHRPLAKVRLNANMLPRAWFAVLLTLAGTACLPGAGGTSPPLPRDTLPEVIPLTEIPRGLPPDRRIPEDNPLTEARVRLGRKLFFDPLLSRDRSISCASCHDPAHGFAGRDSLAVGIEGKRGRRNAPSLLNRAYAASLFWDGRETTLEAQALQPIEDPLEMGNQVAEVVRRLRDHPDYPAQFQAAFADGVTADNLARALAGFQRTLLLGNSRVDRFRAGEVGALSASEKHGLWLWESKGRCWRCHSGPNFTDEQFHNTGVGWGKEPPDLGRFAVTGRETDRGRFKTPTLRGVARTAPYMHDGSIATLEEVVEFYNQGGRPNPHLDPAITPLGLSKQEVQSLVAFLRALSEGDGPTGPMRADPPR
ncbi:MAG TPA: cytochrome c peroxidase [Gemmataceae bacterium]|nr:cytochrome c peroxidase [Gemmataceae bacterium]